MTVPSSQQRMAHNEAVFRTYNESVLDGLENLKAMAQKYGQTSHLMAAEQPLRFYCECFDENCTKRVEVLPSEYARIHQKRDRFIVVPGHESHKIERVINLEPDFAVVKKFVPIPDSAKKLQTTELSNS